eukprot:maker-scaffold336_size202805-snap-gene-1.35 protein:Tk02910 transcript:maker-scaffold336_size202805-snap-gene-1.35-mRNA-1 annotation:"zinc finger protein 729-like"
MSQFSTTGPVGSSANNDGVAIATKTGVKVEGDQVTLSNSSGNAIGANDNGTGTHHTVEMAGDTIQLMGMAGSLPTSNLYVNYPHTMWEKDAEGNRIPVQVIKQEGSGVDTPDDVVNPDDLLSQATASIKQEHGVIIRTLPNDEESAGSGATPAPQRKQPTQLGPDGQPLPRPHLCEVCQKTFVKREHLTKHLRIHKNDNKRYSCEYCQKAFRDRYELVRHTRRHTGDFPFRCETCGKGFLRRERYVTHVRIHTGEKPFVCAVCSRGYRDKRELKKHQISHNHSGQSAPIPGVQPSPQASTSAGPTAIMTNQGINSHMNVSHALGSPEPKTIIVQQSISLPNQPVPRELLNLNGNVQQVVQHQPLNPATIPLPPSVASALQSINEKVAAKQAKMAAAKLMSQTPVPPQTITIAKQDNSAGQLKDPSPGVGDPLTISPTLTFPDDSLMKVRQDEANDDDDEEDEEEDEDDEEEEDRSSSALSHATSSSVSSFVHEAPAINSQPFKTINQVGGQFVPEDYGQPGESAPNLVLSSIGTVVSVPPFAENNNGLNSENPLGPDPSGGSTARPLVDLTVQAKRGKSAPHVCQYCQREYKEKHRYDVHIRFHTGEKPYTCPTCHKGFREQRKLNLHVARHNSSLGHKCHLCPRSFEGPKALNKHLDAHKNNRYVAPKVFKKADGTIAMVLPEDHNYKKTVPPNTTLASSSLGAQSLTTAQVPPLPVGDPLFKDPAKETRMVISARGQKFEIPTIVTSGYDLDNLMCTFCNKGFKNDKTLMGHMLNHFGVTPKMAHCPICGLTLQKKSYARHLRLHGNVVPEMCPYCQKEFREKRSLEKHIRAVHQADRPYPCNHCEARFKSLMDQTNHSQMHLNDFPHKCHVCGLTFEDVHSLGSHYKLHSGVKPFTCDICGKSFTSEKNKRVHVLRHQGSLPFKCDVCNMTFQLQSQLSKHAASHTRKTEVISAKINTFLESFTASLENDMLGLEEGFDADQTVSLTDDTSLEAAAAEAAFVFGQNDLTEELLGETGDESVTSMSSFGAGNEFTIPDTKEGEPLQCQTCQMVLKNKRSYIIHMKRHAGLLKFKCRYCPRTFQGNSKLNRHLRVHVREGTNITPPPPGEMSHKAPTLSIQEIGERVSTPGSSKHVMREQEVSVETIKCALCPKTFTDNESLQTHTLVHFQGNANERKIDSNLLKEKLLSRKRPIKYKALTKVQKVASVMFHPFTYKCTLCDVDLPSKSSRAVHNIVKHKRRSWKCKFCSTLFFNRTQLLDHLEADHKVDKEEIQMLGILKKASIFSVHRKPYKPPLPPSPSPPPTPIGSGSGTGDGISPSPSLKFIHNEELFDNANLTCLACNKAFKNARAFKLHCDRHQGTLKHKCPECVKSFNGRSEVNRHCIAIHSRPLGHNEETVQRCGSASANYDQGPRVVANFSLPAELTNELGTNLSTFAKELLVSDSAHPMLIKQDPVMMSNERDDHDLILPDTLHLFEGTNLDHGTDPIHLSIDDIASFAQPMCAADGSQASFDTSIETASFLSGADALDIASETTNGTASLSLPEIRSESGTPSLPDDGEFPCGQCDKKFGNRRNLVSHMRRHTGDYKLFCLDCNKGFFTQSKLDSHKRKHTGEKPFRCLFKPCLKRFRYKGDLSKHIKRYHPGHVQELVPIPLQEDEMATLQQNMANAAMKKTTITSVSATVTNASALPVAGPSKATITEVVPSQQPARSSSNSLFFPLLPQHPVKPSELQSINNGSTGSSQTNGNGMRSPSATPTFVIQHHHQQSSSDDNNDPSLDENIIEMLTADDDDESSSHGEVCGFQSPSPNPSVESFKTSTPILHNVLTKGAITIKNEMRKDQEQHHPPNQPPSELLQVRQPQYSIAQIPTSKPNHIVVSAPVATTTVSSFLVPSAALLKPIMLQSSQRTTASGIKFTLPSAPLPTSSHATANSVHIGPKSVISLMSSNVIQRPNISISPASLVRKSSTKAAILRSASTPTQPMGMNIQEVLAKSQPVPMDESQHPGQPRSLATTKPATATSSSVPPIQIQVSGHAAHDSSSMSATAMLPGRSAKPFPCSFSGCMRSFEKSNLLRRHMKLHSGDCKFVCDICKKCFESQSKLDDHYRKHTGEKPFVCPICGNTFRYKGDRTKHLKNLHGVTKMTSLSTSTSSTASTSSSTTSEDKLGFFANLSQDETNSSLSSFHSNSDSLASGSVVLESPVKVENMEVINLNQVSQHHDDDDLNVMEGMQETVTMSLDEVVQFAQPIVTDYY